MRRVGKGFFGKETPLFPTIVVHNQEEIGEGSAIPTDPHHTRTCIQPSPQPQKTQQTRRPKKKDTRVPQSSVPNDNVANETVYKELDDSLMRDSTTASRLEAEQDSGNIAKTQSKAIPNESSSLRTTSGGGPRCQETMRDTIAQTRVLDLETTKTTQTNEIASLKKRVKKLEKNDRSRTHKLKKLYKVGLSARVESSEDEEDLGEDASKQGRIADTDDDAGITLEVFVVEKSENIVKEVVDAAQTITTEEITLAQALADLKSTKPKAKGIASREPGESTTTTPIPSKIQDKGKEKLIKPEPVKKLSKKDQLKLDEEIALKLQAEIDKEERIARAEEEKIDEANIAWYDIQAKVDADYQLAERLQAEEQEQFTIEQKATLFKELLEQRRKHFAAKRAEEERNKPPTKNQ
ncbi:hypothetical protein Tco_0603444 [Tanacetum coccineum]